MAGAIIARKEVRVMASPVEVAAPLGRDLSPEESRAFFDAKARELLGISGDEFMQRWNAGDYDEIADDPAHSDIMYLAILGNAR
jgi:hypothetical protein